MGTRKLFEGKGRMAKGSRGMVHREAIAVAGEECSLCGKSILRRSEAQSDVCKDCEEIMPLDEIWT